MKIKVVTSFNERLWNQYGEKCIQTWLEHFNLDTGSVFEFWINGAFPRLLPMVSKSGTPIRYKSLDNQSDALVNFRNTFGNHPRPQIEGQPEYKWNFLPYSYKVFSLAQAAWNIKSATEQKEIFDAQVWLDADVMVGSEINTEWLMKIVGQSDFAWLDRGQPWGHGETGFMYCKTWRDSKNEGAASPLDLFLEVANAYSSGQLFYFSEWHDAYITTAYVRLKEFQDAEHFLVQNLNQDMDSKHKQGLYPFETSILSEKMVHYKGNLKDSVPELPKT